MDSCGYIHGYRHLFYPHNNLPGGSPAQAPGKGERADSEAGVLEPGHINTQTHGPEKTAVNHTTHCVYGSVGKLLWSRI